MSRDVYQDPCGQGGHCQSRAAGTDKRQCNSFGRGQANHDSKVHHRLGGDGSRDCDCSQSAKAIPGPMNNDHAGSYQSCEQTYKKSTAGKTQFFADDGKDEIGSVFRKPTHLHRAHA